MNHTKWEELRLGMYRLGRIAPKFRVRNLVSGNVSAWDSDWFYHFAGDHSDEEWVEIAVGRPEQSDAVVSVLRAVHVPGIPTKAGFRVFGYVPVGANVEYL